MNRERLSTSIDTATDFEAEFKRAKQLWRKGSANYREALGAFKNALNLQPHDPVVIAELRLLFDIVIRKEGGNDLLHDALAIGFQVDQANAYLAAYHRLQAANARKTGAVEEAGFHSKQALFYQGKAGDVYANNYDATGIHANPHELIGVDNTRLGEEMRIDRTNPFFEKSALDEHKPDVSATAITRVRTAATNLIKDLGGRFRLGGKNLPPTATANPDSKAVVVLGPTEDGTEVDDSAEVRALQQALADSSDEKTAEGDVFESSEDGRATHKMGPDYLREIQERAAANIAAGSLDDDIPNTDPEGEGDSSEEWV